MCPVVGNETRKFTALVGNAVFVQRWGLGFEKLPNTKSPDGICTLEGVMLSEAGRLAMRFGTTRG